MDGIKITIAGGCKYTPSWITFEKMVQECTDDSTVQLVGINRPDKGCGYRLPGFYNVKFRKSDGRSFFSSYFNVELEVK